MPEKDDKFTARFNLRLTPFEKQILERIAHREGVDSSSWIRGQIRKTAKRKGIM